MEKWIEVTYGRGDGVKNGVQQIKREEMRHHEKRREEKRREEIKRCVYPYR